MEDYKIYKDLRDVVLTDTHNGVFYTEEWKDIDGTDGAYKISSFGRVKSLGCVNHPEKIKNQSLHKKSGYLLVSIWQNNKEKKLLVHRVVAKHFILNNDNKPQVNHKEGVKHDNRFFMLEWNTQSENMKHSFSVLGTQSVIMNKKGKDSYAAKPVNKYSASGVFLERFDTVTQAAKSVGSGATGITAACKGRCKIVKGFKWKYA